MSSPTEKRGTMTSSDHCVLAQRLNDATRDGRLVDAYRVLTCPVMSSEGTVCSRGWPRTVG